jgi:hypothetical protein
MHTKFDIFEQAFLPWRDVAGRQAPIGLQEALKRAGELATLGDAGPQTTFAVVRMLLVLMHQTRPKCTRQEWLSLWADNDFPDDWLTRIKNTTFGKFDLFDLKRPFLQNARADEKPRPASDLIAELPADTNINHTRHVYDDRVALCPACCGLGILRLAAFCGQGGKGKAPSINAPPPVYFLPIGDTLFRTLLLNWPLDEPVEGDRPSWEEGTTQGRDRIGLLEGFTWEPRSLRLIPSEAQGKSCTLCGRIELPLSRHIIFQQGRDRGDRRLRAWRDPHVAYAEETSKKGVKRVRTLISPEPLLNPLVAAGFWREIMKSLLGSASAFSCAATTAARRLRPSDNLTFLVVVTHTRQAKVLHDRYDVWTIPPPDEQRDQSLTAELGWLADGLEKLPDIAPRLEFERRAERHFRNLLARRGADIPAWRKAIRDDMAELTRSAPAPGRALETLRGRNSVTLAINRSFPMPEEA